MPLREFPILRRLKTASVQMPAIQRGLARYIHENFPTVAFSNVAEIAKSAGVSEATVVRFAKSMGYSGYPDFQREVRRIVRAGLRSWERFMLSTTQPPEARTKLQEIAEKERENIANLVANLDERSVADAVHLLKRASEVIVVGIRSTASLAQHLYFGLGKISVRAKRFTTISSETYDYLSKADRRACVIVIGFPRYLAELSRVLEFAKSRQLKTLTITDSPFSPLRGKVTLCVPRESVMFIAFNAAPLVLINYLLHELSMVDQKKTLDALDQFEIVAEGEQYFLKD